MLSIATANLVSKHYQSANVANFIVRYISLVLCVIQRVIVCSSGECRQLEFKAELALPGKRLTNHMIGVHVDKTIDHCEVLCYLEPNCVSYNFKIWNENEGSSCELNNSTHEGQKEDLVENTSYVYHGARSACTSNPCKNNATCQTGFTERGYRCLCVIGFTGHECGVDVDGCALGTDKCSVNALCSNSEGTYSCTCKLGYSGDGTDCDEMSCQDLYQTTSVSKSPHCSLGACGQGAWMLVMKIDGKKETFRYDSKYWTNQLEYNPVGGQTGFDSQETKLMTYWNTSFTKICLGMKVDQQISFIAVEQEASSLFSLIADGQHRATSLGRKTWKTLIGSEASLQLECNMEGFNVVSSDGFSSKARIGIISNEQNDCSTCDSRIGFGIYGSSLSSNRCGNVAQHSPDNGEKNIAVMGYIFVR